MNKWLMRLIGLVVPQVTPALKDMVTESLNRLEEAAKKTPNPYDDVLVEMLRDIMTSK